ncbi:MAG: pteridine reductase [Methylococcales bacterium]
MQKNVLITGAAKRIGAACARLLHSEGYNVFLHYKSSKEAAFLLCQELNSLRINSARMMQADLLDSSQLEALANEACLAWGGIDVLVNNASSFYPTAMSEVNDQQWDDLIGSNLKAPFFLAKLLVDTLVKNQGCIVNLVDIHAERGLKGYPVYSIAKAGLVAMTKVLAKELGPDIRVNAIAPGAIIWPETLESEQQQQEILQRVVLKRQGQPEDIAKAVRFLIQDADYITGQILTVDGGRTLFY